MPKAFLRELSGFEPLFSRLLAENDPALGESIQIVQGHGLIHRGVDCLQVCHERLYVLVGYIFAGIPELMDDAVLNLQLWCLLGRWWPRVSSQVRSVRKRLHRYFDRRNRKRRVTRVFENVALFRFE